MIEENKQPGIELISKYLSGEATPEEAMHLHQLLKDPGNKKEYDKIVQLWSYLPNQPSANVLAVKEEWIELERKIANPKKPAIRKVLFTRLAIAASVIGLIFIISYSLFTNNDKGTIAQNTDEVNVIKTAPGEIKSDTLPDGSVIIMNKNSSLAYAPGFNDRHRNLELKGEAFFNVVPDKTTPFIIAIDELKIKVVGTSFNVRSDTAGHTIEVQVQSGIVKIYTEQKELTILKGQTGIYSKQNGEVSLKDTLDVNSLGYATKTFSFNDVSFVTACQYLEKTFNVIIKIDPQKFSECRISAEFNNKPLDYILDIVTATFNSRYKKQGNIVYITGEGCR